MLDGPCTNVQPTLEPITITLPDGHTISSTHTGLLPLPNLPYHARQAHLFPSLKSGSLVSIGLLCDAGCTALFSRDEVVIRTGALHVVTGPRTSEGLWRLNLQPRAAAHANLATLATQTASDRIAFLHAAAGYPVVSTWLRAITQGFYTTWPGLTTQAVKRHLPKSTITALGHMDQHRANTRSTKTPPPSSSPNDAPARTEPNDRLHYVYADCQPITGQIYSDLPGRFLTPSSRGHNYLLVVYDYDSNAIIAEPMKNRQAATIVAAYKTIHSLLVS